MTMCLQRVPRCREEGRKTAVLQKDRFLPIVAGFTESDTCVWKMREALRDYILVKEQNFERALSVLVSEGYTVV